MYYRENKYASVGSKCYIQPKQQFTDRISNPFSTNNFVQYIPNPFNSIHLFLKPPKSCDYLLLTTEKLREARRIDLLTSRSDDAVPFNFFLVYVFPISSLRWPTDLVTIRFWKLWLFHVLLLVAHSLHGNTFLAYLCQMFGVNLAISCWLSGLKSQINISFMFLYSCWLKTLTKCSSVPSVIT